ncbi:hypothetical protein GUJ93_ZPchr0010g10946 [Zizania palustris]|uniref:Uncharacterized protein n=1 Tax=Zizania palustris TaxID=103762 RepID=A0A8J5W733_ZIZPA|nr:hypothetical protein GUJ93_ZPchr0010g10946 [Zizania palustris]
MLFLIGFAVDRCEELVAWGVVAGHVRMTGWRDSGMEPRFQWEIARRAEIVGGMREGAALWLNYGIAGRRLQYGGLHVGEWLPLLHRAPHLPEPRVPRAHTTRSPAPPPGVLPRLEHHRLEPLSPGAISQSPPEPSAHLLHRRRGWHPPPWSSPHAHLPRLRALRTPTPSLSRLTSPAQKPSEVGLPVPKPSARTPTPSLPRQACPTSETSARPLVTAKAALPRSSALRMPTPPPPRSASPSMEPSAPTLLV